MASRSKHRDTTYKNRAHQLKSWGLVDYDLRSKLTPSQKANVSKLWNRVGNLADKDVSTIEVSRRDDTGNRLRIGNKVFVAREGATQIRYNKKAKTITKTIRQFGSIKRMRAPLAPKPEDIPDAFAKLKRGQMLMVRNSDAKGLTPAATILGDLKAFQHYKKLIFSKFEKQANRAARERGLTKRESEKLRREYAEKAGDILDAFYAVEYEETEMPDDDPEDFEEGDDFEDDEGDEE